MKNLVVLATSFLFCIDARVTFPHSEVLQAQDLTRQTLFLQATFTCKNECKVYVDRKADKIVISHDRTIVANFNMIVGNNSFAPAGLVLQAGDYVVENRGDDHPDFVLYVVDSKAPNYGASVYVPQDTIGIAIKDKARFVTILSSFDAMWWSGFTGDFPTGYPRIYSTGFDAAGDAKCNPVFQARSQYNAENSWQTIASAVMTVDFGFTGVHNVSVNKEKSKHPMKNGAVSTVYTSPGYVGCDYNAGQNYHSKLTAVEDSFALLSDSLDLVASSNAITDAEKLHLRINNENLDMVGSTTVSKHYGKGTFDVELSWERSTASSSWAVQLDFGVVPDSGVKTTTVRTSISPSDSATISSRTNDLSTTSGQSSFNSYLAIFCVITVASSL